MQRRVAILLILALLCALSSPAATAEPASTAAPAGEAVDGTLRVWLQSLRAPQALGLTLEGSYAVDGDRGFQFEPGTEISLGLDGERLMLKVGGAAIDMGTAFTLTRHLDPQGNAGGVYIHESERDTLYRGDLSFAASGGGIRVIATLDMEEYLYGVLPYEMNEAFPLEALKAQAVAARTYAMQRKAARGGSAYDLVDTADDQVFKGYNPRLTRPIQAVDETRGLVGMYDGRPAECFYSASNGGQTALASDVWGNGTFPYLDIRDDPYDLENPDSVVKSATVSRDIAHMNEALYLPIITQMAEQLQAAGEVSPGEAVLLTALTNVEAVNPIYGGESRQYGTVRFTLEASVRRFTGEETDMHRMLGDAEALAAPVVVELSFYDQVRTALGIGINGSRHDMLTVTADEAGFTLTTRRYGHGVGLSQRGAEWMAKEHGMAFMDILSFYYPGLTFERMAWQERTLTPTNALPESLGYAAPRPTPAPTPAPLPPLSGNEYYAVVVVEGTEGTLNVRNGPSTEHDVVGVVRNGSRMIIQAETEDGWAKMKTVELEGYVSMTFIMRE